MHDSMESSILACARSLATDGHGDQALGLLESHGLNREQALILRGKVLAQQGRLSEAIDAWKEVLQLVPDHSEASSAIRRAERIAAGGLGWFYRFSSSFLILIALSGIALTSAIVWGGMAVADSRGKELVRGSHPSSTVTADNSEWQFRLKRLELDLRSKMASNQSELMEKIADITALRHEMSQAEESMEEKIQQTNTRIDQVEGQAMSQAGALAQIREWQQMHVNASEERSKEIVSRLAGIDDRLSLVDSRIQDLRGDAMQWRAYDLTLGGQLNSRQLNMVESVAGELQLPSYDEHKRAYGQTLSEWVKSQRAR